MKELELFLERYRSITDIGATEQGGCERLSMSDEDMAARGLLLSMLQEDGFEVFQEATGAIFARLVGSDPTLPAILTGSHIDTVRTGGRYDG